MEGILEFAFVEISMFFLSFYSLVPYLGIIFDAKYFRGTSKNIHDTSLIKSIARFFVSLI
jgi:hypothetical protein